MVMSWRNVFAAAGVAAAASIVGTQRVSAQSFDFKPKSTLPRCFVEILNFSFAKYRLFSSTVEQLATGMRWAEGPVWFGDGLSPRE